MVNDGAVGAAQGTDMGLASVGEQQEHWSCTARVDGVQGLLVHLPAAGKRERQLRARGYRVPGWGGLWGSPLLHLPSSRPGLSQRNPGQPGSVSERPPYSTLTPSPVAAISMHVYGSLGNTAPVFHK